ncbi:MAG TPA: YncE family protein [Cyanothece sp. UBA12306]|nr:YncE family protein [Cyanothece sp. UBA12306]
MNSPQSLLKASTFSYVTLSIFSVGIQQANAANFSQGQVVIANRNSGNISVINVANNQVVQNVALPFDLGAGEQAPEPMYVVYLPSKQQVAVGDRANDRIVFFNQKDYGVVDTVNVGNGVFHMWADPVDNQLWVNNDEDRTISVIDLMSKSVVETIDVSGVDPSNTDKPHDVILDPSGNSAYVSFVGLPGANDLVVKYSTNNFTELERAFVGKDPHLSLTSTNNLLYVPTQDNDEVRLLNRDTLDFVDSIAVPGAHGAGMSPNGQNFYTTNLPSNGPMGLFTIDTTTNVLVGDTNGVDTPVATPHNVVVTGNGEKLYVTHSGASSSTVSVYTLDDPNLPVLQDSIIVGGNNPFGLAFVASVPEPSSVLGLCALGAITGTSSLFKRQTRKK